MAYLRGTRARIADALGEERAIGRAAEAMAAIFSELPGHRRVSYLWSWQKAPWALGA